MPQLAGVGGFADQIEFVENRLFIFRHHLDRAQPSAFLPVPLRHVGDDMQQFHVAADSFLDGGAHHLNGDFAAIAQAGDMHLSDGRRGQRLKIEVVKHRFQRFTVGFFNDDPHLLAGKWRHPIL